MKPRVAFVSHSDFGSYDTDSSRKMRRATALLKEKHPEIEADGEMQGDTALSAAARKLVLPHSKLEGDANILIMPNLDTANVAYQMIKTLADALPVGPILIGPARPAHILTPGVTARGVLNMTASPRRSPGARRPFERAVRKRLFRWWRRRAVRGSCAHRPGLNRLIKIAGWLRYIEKVARPRRRSRGTVRWTFELRRTPYCSAAFPRMPSVRPTPCQRSVTFGRVLFAVLFISRARRKLLDRADHGSYRRQVTIPEVIAPFTRSSRPWPASDVQLLAMRRRVPDHRGVDDRAEFPTRFFAILLIIFMLAARSISTILESAGAGQRQDLEDALKNLSIIGALFIIAGYGRGPRPRARRRGGVLKGSETLRW